METEKKVSVPVFDGTNFHTRKFRMALVLQEKDVWSVVKSGSSTATTVASDATSGTVGQHAKDVKARRLITLGLSDDHVSHVMECGTANEMWSTLEKLNEWSGTAKKLSLR